MKVEHEEGDNNCMIRLEKGHTHTHIAWDKEITGEQFKKIRLQYSDFPEGHEHVHLDTFPSDTLYISIPRGVELTIDLADPYRGCE